MFTDIQQKIIIGLISIIGLFSAGSASYNDKIVSPLPDNTTLIEVTVTPLPTEIITIKSETTPTPFISPTPIQTVKVLTPTTKVQYIEPTDVPTYSQSSELSNDNYYINSQGQDVHSPAYTNDDSIPQGASAICGDGTYSFSQSRRGTCSHHSGVASWL